MNKDVIKVKNITVIPVRQAAFEQAQLRTPHFQQTQNLQNSANRYGKPVAQSTYLTDQSPYIAHLQNLATQAEHVSIRTNL